MLTAPRRSRLCELASFAGLAGAVMWVAGTFAAGVPPRPSAETSEVVEHLANRRGAVLVGIAATAVGLALLVVFFVCVAVVVADGVAPSRLGAAVTVGSWVFAVSTAMAGVLALTAVTWRGATNVDVQTIRLVFDINSLAQWALSAPAAAIAILTPSLVLRRVLPSWLLAMAIAKAAVAVVELAGISTTSGWNTAGYAAGIGAPITVGWIVGTAVAFARRQAMLTAAVDA